jgi:hypothetical protein
VGEFVNWLAAGGTRQSDFLIQGTFYIFYMGILTDFRHK